MSNRLDKRTRHSADARKRVNTQTGEVTTPDGGAAPLRLLIADDLARTRRALRALLAVHPGFEVVGEAVDGEEAVAAVERLRPDLVVLDVRMPRLDGIGATARIKARWPAVRVVAHSLAVERRGDALAAGADAFVPKGAPTGELLAALRPGGTA
jgi:DNA-binding NarL/FixJ family response regulator